MKCIYIICIFILSLTSTLANVVPARPVIYQNYIVDRNDLYWYVQGSQNGPPDLRYVAPNVPGFVCQLDFDITSVLQAAINNASQNNGYVVMPPCPKATRPIATQLTIPDNTKFCGSGQGITTIGWASVGNQPFIVNSNAGTVLPGNQANTNITLCEFSIDGRAASQTAGNNKKCIYMLGVAPLFIRHVEGTACKNDIVLVDGNGAQIGPTVVSDLYLHDTSGRGYHISHASRDCISSKIITINTKDTGFFGDSSECGMDQIFSKNAGCGLTDVNGACTDLNGYTIGGDNQVNNPGGGGSAQNTWNPPPVNIFLHNVTAETCGTLHSEKGQFHGILISGLISTACASVASMQNSISSPGTYDDIHFALANNLPGYGEIAKTTIGAIFAGSNAQTVSSQSLGPPTARYNLMIEDCIAGSMASAVIHSGAAGTGYVAGNVLTLSGGVVSGVAAKIKVLTVDGGGAILTIQQNNANNTSGNGCYTTLPGTPSTSVSGTSNVAVTGGSGSGATFDVTWANFTLSGVQYGDALTGHLRWPAYFTGITISDSDGWISYIPIVTCSTSGTVTTDTVTGRYKPIGKQINLQVNINISTLGTCLGNLVVTLPGLPNASMPINGVNKTTGTTIPALIDTANNSLNLDFVTAPAANNYYAGGVYELQ